MSFSRRYAKDRTQKSPQEAVSSASQTSLQEEHEPILIAEESHVSMHTARVFQRERTPLVPEEKPSASPYVRGSMPKISTQEASRPAPKSSQQQHQSEPAVKRFHWRSFFIGLCLLILAGVMAFGWVTHSRWLFPVRHVALTGNFEHVDANALQTVLQQNVQSSLLFPSSVLEAKLSKLPWVDHVTIKRVWPSTLKISLIEKQAVAHFGKGQLLNADGTLFSVPDEIHLPPLPLIDGPPASAAQLLEMYKKLNAMLLPLHLQIAEMHVSPRLAYTLVLNNGLTLFLGANRVEERLVIFIKMYDKMFQAKASQMQYADMRYSSGMAVGWKNGAAPQGLVKS